MKKKLTQYINSLKKEGLTIQYFSLKGKGLLGYVKNVFTLRSFLSKNKFY